MSRRVSAVVFAVLWSGAMPWTRMPLDPVPALVLVLLGALAGLLWYWLSGASGAGADASQ